MSNIDKLIETVESIEADAEAGVKTAIESAKSALMVAKVSRDDIKNADLEDVYDEIINRLEAVIDLGND